MMFVIWKMKDIEIGICLFRSRARMTNAAEAFWSTVQEGNWEKQSQSTSSLSA
jgi:hypothetical protein